MRLLTRLCCVMFALLLPLLSSSLAPTASAFTPIFVNSLGDTPDAALPDRICADADGACTLRAAIQQANAFSDPDEIGFTITGVINLKSALPTISAPILLQGPGAPQLAVRRDFNLGGVFRVLTIGAGVTVSISGITVAHGLAPLPASGAPPVGGGGIYNEGFLTFRDGDVRDNTPAAPSRTVWPRSRRAARRPLAAAESTTKAS